MATRKVFRKKTAVRKHRVTRRVRRGGRIPRFDYRQRRGMIDAVKGVGKGVYGIGEGAYGLGKGVGKGFGKFKKQMLGHKSPEDLDIDQIYPTGNPEVVENKNHLDFSTRGMVLPGVLKRQNLLPKHKELSKEEKFGISPRKLNSRSRKSNNNYTVYDQKKGVISLNTQPL